MSSLSTTPVYIKGRAAKNKDQVYAYLEGGYESRSHVTAKINGRIVGFNHLPLQAFHFCTEQDNFILYRNDWGLCRP